jgi:hypothetical protein
MRKKIAIGVGLVVVVLLAGALVAGALLDWWLRPAPPPLRAGMTKGEVTDVFLTSGGCVLYDGMVVDTVYETGPDWMGRRQTIGVEWAYDPESADRRLVSWHRDPALTRPTSWWDRARKAVGW